MMFASTLNRCFMNSKRIGFLKMQDNNVVLMLKWESRCLGVKGKEQGI